MQRLQPRVIGGVLLIVGGLLVLLLAALLALRAQWRAGPRWLGASLDELQNDADALRDRPSRNPS